MMWTLAHDDRRGTPRRWAALLAWLVAAMPAAALGEVVALHWTSRTPYLDGRPLGDVGPYEVWRGRVDFAVDPQAAANRSIVDLHLAPTNAAGHVEFSADVEMLIPADLSKARGTLLYDVNNRGRKLCLNMFDTGADHFLLRHGFIVVWSGWIAEVPPDRDLLRLDAPPAQQDGQPLRGTVRCELITDKPAERLNAYDRDHLGGYPPTPRGLQQATLTWRLREWEPRVPIPRDQWRLEVTPAPDSPHRYALPKVEVVLSGGFQPGYLYELIYEAQGSVVQGLGLAGIRDLVSFLKYDTSDRNPLRLSSGQSAVHTALGFGVSQSGRCLRCMLYWGFNVDQHGRMVFDGLMPHVAGGGLGFFNHRFACPSRYNSQHVNHAYPCDMFPFTYGDESHPTLKTTDGILRACRAAGKVPKIMHVQTSAEYWHRSGSLVHTDPLGRRDADIPPEVRIYAIAGAQHSPGDNQPKPRSEGQLPLNPTDYRPVLRALLLALERWVRDDAIPPASRYPRLDDGTLVPWAEQASGWLALPAVRYPEVIQRPAQRDFGPQFATQGIVAYHPPRSHGYFPVLVPRYDATNNEQGMIRLPSVAVPLATYTGWNLRHREIGAENQLLSLMGSYIPLPRTAAERRALGDPRPSLQEKYGSFAAYRTAFDAAARQLVQDGFLLQEDVPRLMQWADKQQALFETHDTGP
jgi:hypothetical protein